MPIGQPAMIIFHDFGGDRFLDRRLDANHGLNNGGRSASKAKLWSSDLLPGQTLLPLRRYPAELTNDRGKLDYTVCS